MRAPAEVQPPSRVDPKFLYRLFLIDHICLLTTMIIALVNMLPGVFTLLEGALPASWLMMPSSSTAISVCAVLSLFFSESSHSRRMKQLGMAFGMLTLAIAAAPFLACFAGPPAGMSSILEWNQAALVQGSLGFSSALFTLLAIAILLSSWRGPRAGMIADGITLLLSYAAFTLVSQFIFGLAGLSSSPRLVSDPTLCCLALLTLVVLFRRTEDGVLSVLWGYGSGSRMARILAPILLLLPITREISRAHLLRMGLFAANYATALLTSTATFVAFLLLFLLIRMINQVQENIQDVTLRDELTGLLSVKGFYLLAEQAFRHCRRAQEGFGVLFVDMDNLKKINDELGHSTGSVALVETAKLLKTNFRDADIIGRVGGDEFVVVSQFERQEITEAIERLRAAVARKNKAIGQRFSISLSIGYAVADDLTRETLQSLVLKADEAMYAEKRSKKMRPGIAPRASLAQLELQ